MRIKLDENLPLALQSGLGALGHDVHSVFDENLAGEPAFQRALVVVTDVKIRIRQP